jgi:hypothetical protein
VHERDGAVARIAVGGGDAQQMPDGVARTAGEERERRRERDRQIDDRLGGGCLGVHRLGRGCLGAARAEGGDQHLAR